jgi:hypothetical protein
MHKNTMMLSLLILGAILFTCSVVVAAPDRPQFDLKARVKQHRRGAEGNLVHGEENFRKIILAWDRVSDAEAYEVCHDCDIDDGTGTRDSTMGDDKGEVFPRAVGRNFECGDRPCLVMPGAPLGYNRFNIRVKVGSEWSAWSKHRNFFVAEPGHVEHEEL